MGGVLTMVLKGQIVRMAWISEMQGMMGRRDVCMGRDYVQGRSVNCSAT